MINQALVYDNCNKLFVYKVMTFGEWLRGEIKRTGMSNAEIARRSGFSPTYIGNLVRDFNPNTKDGKGRPSEEAVESVAKATGGDLDDARAAAGYSRLSNSGNFRGRDKYEKLSPAMKQVADKQIETLIDSLSAIDNPNFNYGEFEDPDKDLKRR